MSRDLKRADHKRPPSGGRDRCRSVVVRPEDFSSVEEACVYAQEQLRRNERMVDIGLALSAEQKVEGIFEMIVTEARRLTNADAGTLYIVDPTRRYLDFVVLQNDTLGVRMGGVTGEPVSLPPVSLYLSDGGQNHANVSSYAALTGKTVNISDVYEAQGFDFTGTRRYDATTGYRSRSMLLVPMKNHEDVIIGVLHLLNATDEKGRIRDFSGDSLKAVGALASQAAVALSNAQLTEGLRDLFYSFIRSIATVIDAKSSYTSGHIERVVKLTMIMAEAVNGADKGPFKDKLFSPDELEELRLAAWMHDVGKITTPERVMNKSTKLETLFDRGELVRTRFELIEESIKSRMLEEMMELAASGAEQPALRDVAGRYEKKREHLARDKDFVLTVNVPGGFLDEAGLARLREIADKRFEHQGVSRPYLTQDELKHLSVRKGTLTVDERRIIERHAEITHAMLSKLPFPESLAQVPEIAGRHHEKLDGTGYPRGLSGADLNLQARILAVADVFEALTAKDRPYKQPMKLSTAVDVLRSAGNTGHIDPDLVDLLVSKGLLRRYADEELDPDQVDEDESSI